MTPSWHAEHTPDVPAGTSLEPGDLVFFGHGPHAVDHVGIYLGDGRMVDAPHTGAVVRVEPVTGFDETDVSFAGTTGGLTPTASVTGSGQDYVVTASGMHGVGTIVANIPAGATLSDVAKKTDILPITWD